MTGRKLRGVIFSDLGQAGAFMSLEWVKSALEAKLGFPPYPGTLNLRLESEQDKVLWHDVLKKVTGIAVTPPSDSFCSASLYPVVIESGGAHASSRLHAAVVVPGIGSYPDDKLEIVAAVKVKDALGVQDGDFLTVTFGAV